jgi:hypothetical protein
MSNISFVMASQGRLEIVIQNIAHLLTMGNVYLALSDRNEMNLIQAKFPELKMVLVPNNPLGKKWQASVDLARKHGAGTIITCGSDDILSSEYGRMASEMVEVYGREFVGVNHWYMTNGKEHYKAGYRFYKNFPAGSGRVFAASFLDKIQWRVFDQSADRRLDDFVMNEVYRRGISSFIGQNTELKGFGILAIKGNWPVMNELKKLLDAPTIDCEKIAELPECFPKLKF